MKVLIVDYGMGNLGSLRRSLEECGADVSISTNPVDVRTAARLILPGVGAFPDAMANLRERGWVPEIESAVKAQVPLLGICLGMQLLAEKGFEGEETVGLGFVPGEVQRLEPGSTGDPTPARRLERSAAGASESALRRCRRPHGFLFRA